MVLLLCACGRPTDRPARSSAARLAKAAVEAKRKTPSEAAQRLAAADRRDHGAAEGLVGERVGHQADMRLLAHARDRRAGHALEALVVAVFPGERERHEVGRVFAAAVQADQLQQPGAAPEGMRLTSPRARSARPWPRTSAARR